MKKGSENLSSDSLIRSPTKNNCCVIIVTYFPDSNFLDRLSLIKKQFLNIIIIDNSDKKSSDTFLQQYIIDQDIQKIENSKNLGIAKALNQGLSYAREKKFTWVACFDQDTKIYGNFFSSLISCFIANHKQPAVYGSNYHDNNKNKPSYHCGNLSKKGFCEQKTVITSGCMIPLEILNHIGGFKEDYFIDSVDHEFCLRARHYGYKVILSCATTMSHSIGRESPPKIFGWLLAPSHSPQRKYYMTRNSLITAKNYSRTERAWAIRQVFRLFLEITAVLVLENNKFDKIKALFKGIKNALLGHMEPWQK